MDFSYRVLPDNTIQIYYYSVNGDRITIPKRVHFKKVTNLDCNFAWHSVKKVPLYFNGDIKQWCELSAINPDLNYNISELHIDGKLIVNELVIPEGVTSINDRVFSRNNQITSLKISDTVTSIGICAFYACKSLKSIVIGKNVTKIGSSAFAYCENLETVIFEEGSKLDEIGEAAFLECKKLKSIIIPDGVKKISRLTFDICTSLRKVVLPANLNYMEDFVFCNCRELKEIEFPKYLYGIGDFCFNSSGLEKITWNNYLRKIGVNCFLGTNLTEMKLPSSVTSIGMDAFSFKTKSLNIPKGVKKLSSLTGFEGELEKIVFEDGCKIKYFNKNAFLGLRNIKTIITGDEVTRCMAKAFIEYGLDSDNINMILEKYINALEKKDIEEYIDIARRNNNVPALQMLVSTYSKRFGKVSNIKL